MILSPIVTAVILQQRHIKNTRQIRIKIRDKRWHTSRQIEITQPITTHPSAALLPLHHSHPSNLPPITLPTVPTTTTSQKTTRHPEESLGTKPQPGYFTRAYRDIPSHLVLVSSLQNKYHPISDPHYFPLTTSSSSSLSSFTPFTIVTATHTP